MTEIATRAEAFGVVAEAVAAGLPAPWRMYLARGCRYLSVSMADRVEWDAWRIHLGCPDLTIRVFETEGVVRRSSVAEVLREGLRLAVELVEDVDLADLRSLGSGWLGAATPDGADADGSQPVPEAAG